ncbi:MCE family protein [Tomitella fengzijianii]|uniref:MCE family protein n=1 Tax=Tomitella fengzijianii TaxID=2597660 RepID=A0A516X0J5_9ACTN|nr:MCE family protein [Tomitella fengzijianii]QDQ96609.1 MCE family protein [Tomitella fengzijianii]
MASPATALRRLRPGASRRDGLRGPLTVVAVFVVLGIAAAVVVSNTLTVPVPGGTRAYSAAFTSVPGLSPGDAVTAAGVRVGRVDSVTRADTADGGAHAVVAFSVRDDVPLDAQVHAAIRYGDMLGVRYLALTAPLTESGARLPAGARIPPARTSPPLDLTAVFDGFKPLFDALDPAQVNSLARSMVDAFGGGDGDVRVLVGRVADVTESLVGHREAIARVVDNLGVLAQAADRRGPELTGLIDGLAQISGTMAQRNDELIGILDDGGRAAGAAAAVLEGRVDTLAGTLRRLGETADSWVDNTDEFNRTMALLVPFTRSAGRITDYGAWLQLYPCTLTAKVGDLEANLLGPAHSEACR